MTPFTILTGWLGAGKTSALNRMLAAPHGKKIAVLVNELGRISIDTQLIVGGGGDVLELAGGCVCCKVDIKNDLWDGIGEIVKRTAPDHVVLETTGIAEPAAILEGLARAARGEETLRGRTANEKLLDRVHPAGVVCVVDAETGASALDDREEARAQVQSADRVLLAKLDVASREAVMQTHAVLDRLAPEAERAAFPADRGRELALWMIEPRAVRAWSTRPHAHAHDGAKGHHHANQLIAISFATEAPLVGDAVMAAIARLGDKLVRAKGFVNLAGEPRRAFVERAGVRTSLELRDAWGTAERKTELVLIGDDLDEAAVHRALWACRAAADDAPLPF